MNWSSLPPKRGAFCLKIATFGCQPNQSKLYCERTLYLSVRQDKAESAQALFSKIDVHCMQHLPKHNLCWIWIGSFVCVCVWLRLHTRVQNAVWLELLYLWFTDYNINVLQATWESHTNVMLRREAWQARLWQCSANLNPKIDIFS